MVTFCNILTSDLLTFLYLFCAVLSGPLLGARALVERGLVAGRRADALVLAEAGVLQMRFTGKL